MEFKILPVEQIIGNILSANQSEFLSLSPTMGISYSWGDMFELSQWILAKDDEISGLRAFNLPNKSKYPLIFMVTPIDGKIMQNENLFEGINFIIACDTKPEWLNQTRETETMPMLTNVANKFIEVISKDKNATILRKDGILNVKFKKVYNYSVNKKENQTLDIWDAISLTFDLRINNNCLKNLKLCL